MAGFSIDFVSPVHFENMAAEISFQEQILCRVSQETDNRELAIEFFHESIILPKAPAMKFPLSEFLAALDEVCEALKIMNSPKQD